MPAQDTLNVKNGNLNIKRLSRLQAVILKVLATIHPSGYSKRYLPRVVAEAYGKGSIITLADKDAALEAAIKRNPDKEGMIRALNDMMFFTQRNIYIGEKPDGLIGWVGGWLSPKFSVSYSRSIRSLLKQGLIRYSPASMPPTGIETWAIFITDRGIARIQNREVKVNAKF